MKGTLEQRLAFGVLSTWARADKEGDLICRHCMKSIDFGFEHAKGCIVPEAAAVLGLKNEFAFNKRTYKLKKQLPPVPRTKPAKFPPLGEVQQNCLMSLKEHGSWSYNCGWVWNTPKGTERIMNSLVKRGLVVEQQAPWRDGRGGTYTKWVLA